MNALALALCISGFVCLCLAMEKHQLERNGSAIAGRIGRGGWRALGWAVLGLAFAASVAAAGWSMGPLLWLGGLSLAGMLITTGILPYRPWLLLPLAGAAPLSGLLWWAWMA